MGISRAVLNQIRLNFKRKYNPGQTNVPPEFKEPRENIQQYYDKVVQGNTPFPKVKPNNAERNLLVLTQVYRTGKDIPEMVSPAMMEKMSNRIKMFTFTSIVVASYFSTRWYMKRRDRRQGIPELTRADYKPLPRKLVSKD